MEVKTDTQPQSDELLAFFKVMGDQNRLRIVGLLAERPHTVEQLSQALGIGASTVSWWLRRYTAQSVQWE